MNAKKFSLNVIAGLMAAAMALTEAHAAPKIKWDVVVNNGDAVPDTEKTFNSYNQPSVNRKGLVVIRARSRGPQRVSGIYTRNMKHPNKSPISKVIALNSPVPQPNNNGATFNETPSFPRIDRSSDSFAFRGNHQPVWTYTPDGGDETKVGTTGIYVKPKKELITGVGKLGVVPDFSYFAVPGESEALLFDVFPGAPSPVKSRVAFKGNHTVPTADPNVFISKTGVYFRDTRNDLKPAAKKPPLPVIRIASTDTVIPNGDGVTRFGSTAPPSAAGKYMIFAGFDVEEAPTMGGLYRARMEDNAALETLVGIGDPVPGETGAFNFMSEGVSFNGRYMAFWGAWGIETKTVILVCPDEGNADRVAYCKDNDDNKAVVVPINQGFFVHDTKKGRTMMIARTGRDGFEDFVYWNYSGHVPGTSGHDDDGGDESDDSEPPRWRSASFVAVDRVRTRFRAMFKATKAIAEGETEAVQGIYLAEGPVQDLDAHYTVVDTGTRGALLDPDVEVLDAFSTAGPLIVSAVGIERDGLRGKWLVLNASMANSDASVSWAGVYAGKLPRKRLIPTPDL
ncbi:MAG: hypothetical protein ACU841_05770 [Gammaproteobacteria bacterium]